MIRRRDGAAESQGSANARARCAVAAASCEAGDGNVRIDAKPAAVSDSRPGEIRFCSLRPSAPLPRPSRKPP